MPKKKKENKQEVQKPTGQLYFFPNEKKIIRAENHVEAQKKLHELLKGGE